MSDRDAQIRTDDAGERRLEPGVVTEKPNSAYRVGHLVIDMVAQTAVRGDRPVCFTPKEFMALHILANADGALVSPHDLIERVWGPRPPEAAQHLRVFIGRIRAKIEDDPTRPKVLLTEKGSGYRMAPNQAHCSG